MYYMLSEGWKAKPRNISTSLAGSREKPILYNTSFSPLVFFVSQLPSPLIQTEVTVKQKKNFAHATGVRTNASAVNHKAVLLSNPSPNKRSR